MSRVKLVVADLEAKDVATLVKLILEQQAELELLDETLAGKEEDCKGHTAKIEELTGTIATLNTIIGNAKPAETAIVTDAKKTAPVIPAEPFEHEGKTYKWNRGSFRLAGDTNKYTAAEAQVQEGLVKRILAMDGQEILKEVE